MKQAKVSNKIAGSLKYGNEGQLRAKNNDECYTDMHDILEELSYWAQFDKFRGKRIICPCDWDIVEDEDIYSIEITYKDTDVEVNAYKAVKSIKITKIYPNPLFKFYSEELEKECIETKWETIELKEDEIEGFLRNKLKCEFVRALTQNARKWGIKSITASGYNPDIDRGIKFQDVDYTKYDLCITNPPFSLYHEFMDAIVDKVDFIVLAPLMSRANLFISQPLMLKQAYLGKGVHLALNFKNPTKENNYSGEKSVACDWLTSFSEAQDERNALHYKSGVKFADYEDEYVEMPNMTMKDDTHPIRVPMLFPEDYNGWMFGGINLLDKLDQSTYEWYCTNCHKFFNTDHPELNPFNHKLTGGMYKQANGNGAFAGIVFRKRVSKDE